MASALLSVGTSAPCSGKAVNPDALTLGTFILAVNLAGMSTHAAEFRGPANYLHLFLSAYQHFPILLLLRDARPASARHFGCSVERLSVDGGTVGISPAVLRVSQIVGKPDRQVRSLVLAQDEGLKPIVYHADNLWRVESGSKDLDVAHALVVAGVAVTPQGATLQMFDIWGWSVRLATLLETILDGVNIRCRIELQDSSPGSVERLNWSTVLSSSDEKLLQLRAPAGQCPKGSKGPMDIRWYHISLGAEVRRYLDSKKLAPTLKAMLGVPLLGALRASSPGESR